MVAVVAGSDLGLLTGSAGVLGGQGLLGTARQGSDGSQVYVNAATGDLVVQRT